MHEPNSCYRTVRMLMALGKESRGIRGMYSENCFNRQVVRHLRILVAAISVALLLGLPAHSFGLETYPDDAEIAVAIDTQLMLDSAVNSNTLTVAVQDGVVTLKGSVASLLERDRATAIAQTIVGVRTIVNRITLGRAPDRPDAELAEAVERALFNDPTTDSYEIEVVVSRGIVKLEGTVQSHAERQLCETVAKGIKGVKGIHNAIEVVFQVARSDIELRHDVEGRLRHDVRIDPSLIDVAVEHGTVRFSGAVGSLQEKLLAADLAWVAGVVSVDVDDLEVVWHRRDEMRRKSGRLLRTDDQIRRAIADAFRHDPRVSSLDPHIDIEVSDATVTLTGVVDSLKARMAAEQDVRNTAGVWHVRNSLKVRDASPTPDNELEDRIEEAFFNDPFLERVDVTIEARDGIVFLTGNVNTSLGRQRAESIAERIAGVAFVINNLTFDHLWTWKADWEIRSSVQDQLAWSPFVGEDDIEITVDNGVVTLSGSADTWSERWLAEINAFHGGAREVDNRLEVEQRFQGPYGPGFYWPIRESPKSFVFEFPIAIPHQQ